MQFTFPTVHYVSNALKIMKRIPPHRARLVVGRANLHN